MTATDEPLDDDSFDPAARRLCPDDTCIGLIGPDGRCKVCGAVSPEGAEPPAAADEATEATEATEERTEEEGAPCEAGAEAFDPDARILCSDDTCTGLVGPDGRCKECGQPQPA